MKARDISPSHRRGRIDLATGTEGGRLAARRIAAMAHARSMAPGPGGGYLRPVPGGNNWVPLGPMAVPNGGTYSGTGARVLVSGRVTAIVVDPTDSNTIYLGSAYGGVWKTIDGGATWTPKSDYEASLAIGALVIDPTNSQILYAGTGEGNLVYLSPASGFVQESGYYGDGLLKTTDGGDTWTLYGAAEFTGAAFFRIAVDRSNPTTLFAATSHGLYRSMDGGSSWSLMSGLPAVSATILGCTDVVIDPSSTGTVYAALWADGIYKSSDATAVTPTWTKLTFGLPSPNYGRIALAISPSSPRILYASLMPTPVSPYSRADVFRTTDGGSTWSAMTNVYGGNLGLSLMNYCDNIAVHPRDPDIVYLSAYGYPYGGNSGLWKVTGATTASWNIAPIGDTIHPDHHSFAFDPNNPSVVYAGCDGGIYKSTDGGTSWSDAINKGLCLTQFEFIAQHPTSDAVVFGGSQDNGTEQVRNSPVFNFADDGDGGYTAVDQSQPRNVLHTYYGASLARSTEGGKYGTWVDVSPGLQGSLFYPPFALNTANQNEIAYGTDRINLDPVQGRSGWPVQVALPNTTSSFVSAVNFVNSNLIYAGSEFGEVYRLMQTGGAWSAAAIHAPPFPARFIWDIAIAPSDPNTIIVAVSGFGTPHVWRGVVSSSGAAMWTSISGTGTGRLPDIPAYAVVVDPADPTSNTIYVGTDVGVFRTLDGGLTWSPFSSGLPNGPVFDLELHNATRLLRACIHGRGMWELKLDVTAVPDVNIFVRGDVMDTGRVRPPSLNVDAAFEDPLEYVRLGDTVWWWQCADIKVDALEGTPPAFQMNVRDVDFVAFESALAHRKRGPNANRVYVQIHNRGIAPATSVSVKVLSTKAAAGLPDLPPDFWTAFPGDSAFTTAWKPIGPAQTIASLSPAIPPVLEWDWMLPARTADHSCLLVVADCAADPIPAANKVFDIFTLVTQERHVGLKNVHVGNIAPRTNYYWTPFWFFGDPQVSYTIRISPMTADGWNVGLLVPGEDLTLEGVSMQEMDSSMVFALLYALFGTRFGSVQLFRLLLQLFPRLFYRLLCRLIALWGLNLYVLDQPAQGGAIAGVSIPKVKGGLGVWLLFYRPGGEITGGFTTGSVSITQERFHLRPRGQTIGGSTFVLKSVSQ